MIDAIKNIGGMALTGSLEGASSIGASMGQSALGSAAASDSSMSFAQVLGDMAKSATDSLKAAEVKSFEGIRGEANTREVVDAVMNAEQSLQTAIAIRDKVVASYLEIVRMAI